MVDVVAELRALAFQIDPCLLGGPDARLLNQAADEIEALRKGLAQILDLDPVELALDPEWAQRKARALLKGTPDNGQG